MNEDSRESDLLTQPCLSYIQKATGEAFERFLQKPQYQKISGDSVVDAAIQVYLGASTIAQVERLSLQGILNTWFPAKVQRSTMEKLSHALESGNVTRDALVDCALQLYLAEYDCDATRRTK